MHKPLFLYVYGTYKQICTFLILSYGHINTIWICNIAKVTKNISQQANRLITVTYKTQDKFYLWMGNRYTDKMVSRSVVPVSFSYRHACFSEVGVLSTCKRIGKFYVAYNYATQVILYFLNLLWYSVKDLNQMLK